MRAGWAVAGGTALTAAAALGGLGLFIARRITAPVGARKYELLIRGVDDSGDQTVVILDRTPRTAAHGSYCLLLENGGWVRFASDVENRGPALVGRRVAGEPRGKLLPGARASWSGIFYSDPQDAGLVATDVDIATDVGMAPAWLVPPNGAASTTWAIHIHGLGSPRAGTLRGVQVAQQAGLMSLVVSYRNDGEGPTSGAGRSALGTAEMHDVRAALRFAQANGARHLVLFGWSMGAAIALRLAAEPEFDSRIASLVLESPIIDWIATIKSNCVRAGLPSWAGATAVPWLNCALLAKVLGLPGAASLRDFDWLARAHELEVPTLILHGTGDSSSPFEASDRLKDRRGDLVRLEAFDADHTMTWNSAPARWRAVVSTWLRTHKVPS